MRETMAELPRVMAPRDFCGTDFPFCSSWLSLGASVWMCAVSSLTSILPSLLVSPLMSASRRA